MRSLLIVCLLLAGSAQAQTIYKCQDSKGRLSYQTDPCERGKRLTSVKAYAPIHDDPNAAERSRRIEADMSARSSNSGGNFNGQINNFGSTDGRSAQRAQCDGAKASRQSTLNSVGLSRTYELLQQLDQMVNNACKGM